MKRSVAGFAVLAVLFLATACSHYSQGDRIGVINKFSRKGLVCKTWEGEMNLGGTREESDGSKTSIVANVWEFTVRDADIDRLKPKIEDAMEKGYPVKIGYDQSYLTWCSSDSSYFVTEIIPARSGRADK